jgi:P27 family predicted phage terminase small subunit
MAARSPDGVTPGHRNLPVPVKSRPDHTVPVPARPLTGRGLEEWEKVWTAGFWLKRDQDYPWVEMIARAYSDIEVFRAKVEEDGLVVQGYAGQMTAHPLIAEIRKCETTIQKCLSILGFSPSDRARLAITEAKAQSALLDMIEQSKR